VNCRPAKFKNKVMLEIIFLELYFKKSKKKKLKYTPPNICKRIRSIKY